MKIKFEPEYGFAAKMPYLVIILTLMWLFVIVFFWGSIFYILYLVLKHIGLIGIACLM